MEVFEDYGSRPPGVLDATSVVAAAVLHVVFFAVIWLFSAFDPSEDETVIPIDMTVVINENLDGVENEPPPTHNDPPSPPTPPKPPTPPEPKPPEPEPEIKDSIKTNIVEKVERKPEKPKLTEAERIAQMRKQAKPSKPEKPTKKTLSREEQMRQRAKPAGNTPPVRLQLPNFDSGNGRTARRTLSDEEVMRQLGLGAKPGTVEQLASSEEQRCVSLIKNAFYEKWDQVGRPPWSDTLKTMSLKVRFGVGGRVLERRFVASSGDAAADSTVRRAGDLVNYVSGLSDSFIRKNGGWVTINFKVRPE